MKKIALSFFTFLSIGLLLSCQDTQNDKAIPIKADKNANARRACNNTIVYKFIYPDNDYVFNGFGCQDFYVHRGATRQFKVQLTNAAGYAQPVKLQIEHPDNTSYIQYSIASFTGGSVSIANPVPGTSNGEAIVWQDASMPGFTTWELTFNVTGVVGSAAAENGVSLRLKEPCEVAPLSDCDADENLHLVLTN